MPPMKTSTNVHGWHFFGSPSIKLAMAKATFFFSAFQKKRLRVFILIITRMVKKFAALVTLNAE